MNEHQLQQLLMNYLQAKGWYVQRMNSGRVRTDHGTLVKLGETGTPDLMAFKPTDAFGIADLEVCRLLFIEVKTPKNPKPTFAQVHKMEELEQHGARCYVVHSLEELEDLAL